MAGEERDERKAWATVYSDALTYLAPGLLIGLLCGGLVGGVGGRLAMFLLRLTSDESLHGLETDDGFKIGSFTGDTVFLVLVTMFLGVLGGLIYVGIRQWLPEHLRPLSFGLLTGTIGGALIIRPDGIDFTLLEPLSLAVVMFVALPTVYGVAVSVIVEKLDRSRALEHSRWRWVAILTLIPLAPTGPLGLAFLLLLAIGIAANRSGRVARFWRSAPVTWIARAGLAMSVAVSGWVLVRDISEVL